MSLQEYALAQKRSTECKICNLPEAIRNEVLENIRTNKVPITTVVLYIYEAAGVEVSTTSYSRHAVHAERRAGV